MKAIILTAGYGRRMQPLTNDNHKTLLKIGEESIIERIINGLIENDITEVVIVTGYLKDMLSNFLLEKFPKIEFTFVHNEIYDKTNNIYSMALAFEQVDIDQDIMLIESDLIYHANIIKELVEDRRKNVALVDKYGPGMDGTVVTVEDGTITNVIPPHLQSENFDFSDKYKTLNIYKFSQEFASTEFKKLLTYYAKTIDDNCYYELILGILIYMQRQKIHALTVDGNDWAEVDDPNDLSSAAFVFEKEKQLEMLNYSFGGFWNYDITDFCFIRNMYFPNGSVLSELRNNMKELLQNYGSKQAILDQKLAYYLLCEKENLVCLNGAAQIYPILKNYFISDSVLIPTPTFGEYTRIFKEYKTYIDNGEKQIDLNKLAEGQEQIIVIVNPNNPTGTELDSDDILKLAQEREDKFFIVDESFIEFSDKESLLPKVEKLNIENVLIIKSLSKSLGLPGIRLGYVYTRNTKLLANIRENIPIWNMNSMAENFIEILLKHRNSIQKSFELTKRDRIQFSENLKTWDGVDSILKSGANFITCKLKITKSDLIRIQKDLLSNNSIYIKNVSDKFENDHAYLRLAVRSPKENLELVDILKSK
jgi:histidinol-phosphate/aromatic aminotransferase/cobyric acid decarboxylase-like protein/GTP:adenosylcobinamide-phosphate guanylyltransferase